MSLFDVESIAEFQAELKEFEESLTSVQQNLSNDIRSAVSKTADELKTEVREQIKKNNYINNTDTDRDTKSLLDWDKKQVSHTKFKVYTDAPHARQFEYGYKGTYEIEGNPYLYFDNENGDLIRKTSVEHGTIQGQHFLRDSTSKIWAKKRLRKNILDEVEQSFDKNL